MTSEPRDMPSSLTRAYAGYALGLLALSNLLSFVNRNVLFALFEPLKHDLGLSDAALGWLASAYVLVFSLAALPFGVVGDMRSRRTVIVTGLLVWSLATLASGFATSFATLLVCRALVGLGGAAFGAAAQSLAADYYPNRGRALALGILAAGTTLGGVLGIWVGGHLGALYGWRMTLVAVGAPGFALAALAARLKDPARAAGEMLPISLARANAELVGALNVVVRTPTLVYVFLGGALISFGLNGLVGWAPTFMSRELGLSVRAATALLGSWGLVAGILGAVVGGLMADWLRRYTPSGRILTIGIGLLIGGPLAIWLLTVRNMTHFIPIFFGAFFFLSWYTGPLAAAIFDVVPARISATVAGAYLLFIHLAGDTIAFPLIGALSDRFGIDRAVFVLPSVALAGGVVVLLATRSVEADMRRRLPESGAAWPAPASGHLDRRGP